MIWRGISISDLRLGFQESDGKEGNTADLCIGAELLSNEYNNNHTKSQISGEFLYVMASLWLGAT